MAVCVGVSLTLGLSACGGGIPGDAVLQINGKAISKATFNHWMRVAASSPTPGQSTTAKPAVPEPPAYKACIASLKAAEPKPAKGQKPQTEAQLKTQCEQQYKAVLPRVVGFFISTEWVFGEAEHLGVKVSDKEVDKRLNQIRKQEFPQGVAQFQKFLSSSGQTVSDLLVRVKYQLLVTKIEEKIRKIKITEAEVAKYYNQHKSQYGQAEKRSLLVVLTKTEAQAKQAKSEISSGKSFASIVKKRSVDPSSKGTGGSLTVVKGQEPKPLDEAVFTAKQGVLSGPIKTTSGFYIFEVKSTTPATQQGIAQVKAQIKQQLGPQKQQTAFAKFVKEFEKKWTAKTECRSGYVVMHCKGYKDPKAPASTTAPTVTATPAKTPPAKTTTSPTATTGVKVKK